MTKGDYLFIGALGISIVVCIGFLFHFGSDQQFGKAIRSVPSVTIVNSHPQGNKAGPDYLYPNPNRTPGLTNPSITQSNISQNICAGSAWSTKSIRPPVSYTNSLKLMQLANGYTYQNDTNTADYEEDHFISLELGGNPNDFQNLWPEPYHTQVNGKEVGAKQKDSVENQLHKEVCSKTITLQKAQEVIVQDWYACWLQIQNPKGICQ